MTGHTGSESRALVLRGSLGRCLRYALLVPALSAPAFGGDPQPEQVWSHHLNGESYYNHTVSIGNYGTQVFCDTGYSSQRTRLYSFFNSTGTPTWETYDSTTALNRCVDSSESGNIHAVWRQDLIPNSSSAIARAYLYRSTSSTPFAVHEFDTTDYGAGNGYCSVSDDGRWVIATTGRLNSIHVARFDTEASNPGNPQLETVISRFGPTSQYGCSNDGSVLYLGGPMSGTVVNLSTGQTLFDQTYSFGAELNGHAFSGDGRTIVVPQDEKTRIYRENSGSFSFLTEFDPFPATTAEVPWSAAVSHDGDIVVAAYMVLPAFQDSHVLAWRVSTGEQLLNHLQEGTGTHDNLPARIEISRSGDRFVVGSYGDEGGLTPEIQVFQLNSQGNAFEPLVSFDRPGSVIDMDLSADGNRLAVSGRTVHVNQSGGYKVIEVFDLGTDFRVDGNPRVGHSVEFVYYPLEGSTFGYLLVSNNLGQNTPFAFGTLFIDRQSLTLQPMGPMNGAGTMTINHAIQGSPGSTLYFQGYALGPRQLSKCWLPLTTLP